MKREFHVRFCEGLGVRFPRATRPVLCFEREDDARRVREVLPLRFAKYGLAVHPEKTRLVPFRRPTGGSDRSDAGSSGAPGAFDLLGFTHFWAKSLRGNWVIKRKTASDRMSRALRQIALWCRANRHQPIAEQHQSLTKKLRGHYGYYGITGNSGALSRFFLEVQRLWHKWLVRRSQQKHHTWVWFHGLMERMPLLRPVVVHSCLRRGANP